MKRFLRNSLLFLTGLLAAALLLDRCIGRSIKATDGVIGGQPIIGWEVYRALEHADLPGAGVTTIVTGDSVARQLFTPGQEPGPRIRYLATNQAIGVAGQYYLLRRGLSRCPDAREVDFFYRPPSWANDLPPTLSHDYYCEFFHSPREIADTFRLTRNWDLLSSQIARALFPNLLAANGASRPFIPYDPARAGTTDAAGLASGFAGQEKDPEPALTLATRLSRACPGHDADDAAPPDADGLSYVSRHYLAMIRKLCQQRGIRLRILPSPCNDSLSFPRLRPLYDADMLYFNRREFGSDAIHFEPPYIHAARAAVVAKYRLPQ